MITGTVPAGTYVGLKASVGVPEVMNHSAAVGGVAPLDNTAILWSWQSGRKFTKIELNPVGGITQAVAAENLEQSLASGASDLAGSDLGELFGIELDITPEPTAITRSQKKRGTSAKNNAGKDKSNPTKATSPAAVSTAAAKKPARRNSAKTLASRKAK